MGGVLCCQESSQITDTITGDKKRRRNHDKPLLIVRRNEQEDITKLLKLQLSILNHNQQIDTQQITQHILNEEPTLFSGSMGRRSTQHASTFSRREDVVVMPKVYMDPLKQHKYHQQNSVFNQRGLILDLAAIDNEDTVTISERNNTISQLLGQNNSFYQDRTRLLSGLREEDMSLAKNIDEEESNDSNLSYCTANGLDETEEVKDDFDETIHITENIINENERNFNFTKKSVIGIIEEIIQEQGGWQSKLVTDLTKIWAKSSGGSKWDKSNPCIKCEYIFKQIEDPSKIVLAYLIPSKRLEWDDGIASYSEHTRHSEIVQVVHVVNKAPMNFKNRDFIEKRLYFVHESIHYIYVTFVPDEVKPPTKENQRARSIYGCFKIEKISGEQVKMTVCSQNDLKIGMGMSMVASLMPKSMNEWGDKMRKYIKQ